MTIPQPKYKDEILINDGNTWDIVKAINYAMSRSYGDTKAFSKNFTADRKGLKKLWSTIRSYNNYTLEPFGEQWIKSPSRLYFENFVGNCKDYTVFIHSVLKNLKVDHNIILTSYDNDKDPEHIYIIANLGGEKIVMDATLPFFNYEAPYTYKYSYNMKEIGSTQISYLSGIGSTSLAQLHGELEAFDVLAASEAEYLLYLAKQRYLIKALQTPGQAESLAKEGLNLMQGEALAPRTYSTIFDPENEESISGRRGRRGRRGGQRQPQRTRTRRKKNPNKKGVLKRILNGIFKKLLPKAAPFFLYAVVGEKILSKAAKHKKKGQLKVARWIQKTSGMSPTAFNNTITNGILAQTGKTPKAFISDIAKGKGRVSGIGSVPPSVIMKAIGAITDLIGKLAPLFKKKKEEAGVNKQDAPDLAADFAGFQTSPNQSSEETEESTSNQEFTTTGSGASEGSKGKSMIIPLAVGAAILLFGGKIF